MRVITGIAKGRRLRAAASTRPTTDRARQALFDMLAGIPEGARVLDLFAGSGALGIESLSRGGREAMFVDNSREACDVVLQNLQATGLRGLGQIRRADVPRLLLRRPPEPYDLVFLDPPYERGLPFLLRVLERLVTNGWVRRGGTVVVEAEGGTVDWPPGLRETRARRFGRTQITVAVYDDAERGPHGDLPGHV